MIIIRVFPRRTSHTPNDEYAFVGEPRLDRPQADEVHVSCTFTWDKPRAEYLAKAWGQYYPIVKIGGPAFDDRGNGFTSGIYVRQGIVYNMRGCNNQCPWCVAWKREGKARPIQITEGYIEQSNNILQCDSSHVDAVFDMLSKQRGVVLAGLESKQITDRWAERIRSLRLHQIFLAADTPQALKSVQKARTLLQISPHSRKLRCYVLLKFKESETISEATERLENVWHAGFIPFAQLYQPPDKYIEYPDEWKQLARTWSRPASIVAVMRDKGMSQG